MSENNVKNNTIKNNSNNSGNEPPKAPTPIVLKETFTANFEKTSSNNSSNEN